jgi:hypothetical protein
MRADRSIAIARATLTVAGVLLAVLAGWGSPPWWAPPLLVLATAVAERASVRMPVGRQGITFTLSDAAMAVAFLLAPGAWIALAIPLGWLIAKAGRRPWVKLSFNLAVQLCSAAAGVLVTQLIGGPLGACLGLAVYAVVSHIAVAVPIAATSQLGYGRVLLTMGPLGIVHTAGNASVGLLAGWLAVNAPLGLLGLIVPVGLLWWSYQQQTRRASEAQLFEELAQGQERVAGGTVDASAQVVVTAAARLFGAAQVDMVLRHPDGLLRYVGDEQGVSARIRADAEALDAPWVLRALAGRGVMIGHDGERPYCSSVLGTPGRPLAVLIAHRPARSAAFTRADAQLAEVLVRQAESWLSVADLAARHDVAVGRAEAYGAASRVLGDLGEETVPALAVLRESAHRLSRLASRYDGPDAVDEIVAELYSVERAVASLLGAIALTSDPIGGRPALGAGTADANGSRRSEAEWTTTGRLEDAVQP